MSENVIHLSFKSPHTIDDARAFVACRNCHNKTYTLVEDRVGDFPMMQCAACGQHMGRMGWAYDDPEDEKT